MKFFKILGHPATVIIMFILIIISGEQFGGFYLIYILLGLPYGVPHALLAVSGIVTLLIGYKVFQKKLHILKPAINIIGITIMVIALITFFIRSRGYNDDTFYQTVPLVSLILFSLCAFCSVLNSIWMFAKIIKGKNEHLSLVI